MPHRRAFLSSSLGASTLVSLGLDVPRLFVRTAAAAEAAQGERVLVVLQLSGGNDGLNTVVPYADPLYGKNRIALNVGVDQVHRLDREVGLHPAMRSFAKLLEAGRLAVVQGVGYPNPDRSHFSSMDIWHTARHDLAQQREGWLGRYVERYESARGAGSDAAALHLGGGVLPLALVGRSTAVPSIDAVERFRLRGTPAEVDARHRMQRMKRSNPSDMLAFLQRTTVAAVDSSRRVQEALASKPTAAAYPDRTLAKKLQTIAQMIDAGLRTRIYYVSLDGFDTHANQKQTHAALLGELSDSVAAFVHDLDERGHLDRTCVLMFSEFGRRVKENASLGTDHGAAGPVFLAGGGVKAGVVGTHPSLDALDREGDLKFHTDFRSIYATLLDGRLGASSRDVLQADFARLDLLSS